VLLSIAAHLLSDTKVRKIEFLIFSSYILWKERVIYGFHIKWNYSKLEFLNKDFSSVCQAIVPWPLPTSKFYLRTVRISLFVYWLPRKPSTNKAPYQQFLYEIVLKPPPPPQKKKKQKKFFFLTKLLMISFFF